MRGRLWLPAAAALALMGVLLGFGVPGMRFSGYLLGSLALLCLLWGALGALARRRPRLGRRLRKAYLACVFVGLVCFVGLEGYLLAGEIASAEGEVSCVVVLGAGVNGTVPSLTLSTRLQAALNYLEAHPGLPVVVTGGQGPGEDITEAEAARRWLTSRGVAPEKILLEDRSRSTAENLEYAKAVMEQAGLNTGRPIALVSSDFHLRRAALIAGGLGLTAVPVGAELPYPWLQVNYYMREAFALVKTILID